MNDILSIDKKKRCVYNFGMKKYNIEKGLNQRRSCYPRKTEELKNNSVSNMLPAFITRDLQAGKPDLI